jgi:hypothetical protein
MRLQLEKPLTFTFMALLISALSQARAAELPLVRIAHGHSARRLASCGSVLSRAYFANMESMSKSLTSGADRKHLLRWFPEIFRWRTRFPVPSSAPQPRAWTWLFSAGIVNKADGDFIAAPSVRGPEDLKGKRLGVQSIGGGVWSMTMLAVEYLGLDPNRDKMIVMIVGDSPVLAQSLESGGIEATYLNYTHSRSLKDKGFPVLLDLGKAPIPYQGLAAATRRTYLRQNPQIIDSLMRGFVDSVAFIHKPSNKEAVLKSLTKNLRLKNVQDAETGYEALQWLYSVDVKPTIVGIRNMHRLLALTNAKVKTVKTEDVVDEAPARRLENSAFYREVVAQAQK